MSNRISQPYNKIAAALIMLSPVAAVNAAAPVFIENSVLDNKLEYYFNASTKNSEHMSLAINDQNTIFTAYQDAVSTKDAVLVSTYQQGEISLSEHLSADADVTAAYTFPQIRVNPVDQSLVLGFLENGNIIIRNSNDGITWQSGNTVPVTGTPKIFKMKLDSQGNIYLFYANTLNKSELLKFDGNTWQVLYGQVTTKSTTVTTLSAGLAIDSQDKPILVYRDVANTHKITIASPDSDGVWQTIITTGASNAAYMEVAIDSQDNLHMMHVGFGAEAGLSVYTLDGSDPSDSTWAAVGNTNFAYALAENYNGGVVGTKSFYLKFNSNDKPYVVYQQVNDTPSTKKTMQMAHLVNDEWTDIPYNLASVLKDPTKTTSLNHDYVDIAIDSYDRPVVMLRSNGTGQSSGAYVLRMNLLPDPNNSTISLSTGEGNTIAGKLLVADAEDDAIIFSLSGTGAELFTINETSGELSFIEAPIMGADTVYTVIVSASAGGENTSATVQVTVVNDPSNDTDTDSDGVIDLLDDFPDDVAASIDTDKDGSPDSWNNGKSIVDSTTNLTLDAFPTDAAASVDVDNDGYPDSWNTGKVADDTTTGLVLDAFPGDASEWLDSDSDGVGDNADAFPYDDTRTEDTPPIVTAPDVITVAATDSEGTLATNTLIAAFLTGASVTDADDVDSSITISHDAPDVFPLHDTLVTFTATDSAGHSAIAQATVTISDQAVPVISLIGDSALTLNNTETYEELGATATDNVDGNITAAIVIGGDIVDTSTPGSYSVTYTVDDAAGNTAIETRTINVQDTSTPVVTAPQNITVAATDSSGTVNSEAAIAEFLSSASAIDEQDGVVSVSHNAPPVFPLGVTTIVLFSATDTDGKTGTSQATVTITDQTKPIISLVGETSLTVALNGNYSDAGYSASDNVDGDITANVVVTGTVNVNVIGTYTLTYNVSDVAGHEAVTLTRHITVQDASAPVVNAPQNITVAATDSDGTSISDTAIGVFLAAATANDAVDGDINDIANNALNVFPLGVTTVTFSAQDNAGNAGTAQATVTVVDQTAPVITLTANTVEIIVGEGYIEPGASATDNVDGDISSKVVIGSDALDTNIVGTYSLTYDVSDTAGNAAVQVTRQVVVLNLPDTDGDGIPDVDDAFDTDAAASIDTDNDGSPDSWNDGQSAEDSSTGLTLDAFPTDSNETLDTDGDGFGDNMDPNPTDVNDGTAPVFAQAIATIELDATATLTDISAAVAASGITALDMFDGVVTAKLESTELVLTSGNHEITLSATDQAGNKSTAKVDLAIKPIVQLGASLTVEAGGQLTVPVGLSGPAATYPVVIDYTVTNLTEVTKGQFTIEQGLEEDAVMADLIIAVSADLQQGDELVIQFTQSTNAVVTEFTRVSAVINNENFAPTLKVSINQAGQPVSVIIPSQGLVTLSATVADLNNADEHNIRFDVPGGEFGGEFGGEASNEAPNTLVFDPLNLETGSYSVTVTVAETNTDALLASTVTVQVKVDSELTEIVADSDQDGIPDSVDYDSDTTRLPVAENEQPLQVLPGFTLSIGDLAAGGDSATIDAEVVSSDIHYNALSTITNFNVGGLTISGSSVAVVLPLAKGVTIPSDAIYRKYSERKGWFTFVEDENNSLSSASKDDNGNCPAPSSSAYLTEDTLLANGLIEGKNCIQLTIEDGGANDADETANGTVVDPGVLVSEFENTLPEISLSNGVATSRQVVNLQAAVTDAEGDELSYTWQQIDGLSVDIGTATSDTLSFTAPEVVEGTDLRFKLTVHDGRASTSEEVKVTVTPESVIDTDPRGGSFGWLLSLVALIGLGRRKLSK